MNGLQSFQISIRNDLFYFKHLAFQRFLSSIWLRRFKYFTREELIILCFFVLNFNDDMIKYKGKDISRR